MGTLADEKELLRVVYYGDPGTGKTTAAAGMARLGRIIYVDAEGGLKPRALSRFDIPLDNIEPFRDVTYDGLTNLGWQLKADIEKGEGPVGIVWDSMTAIIPALMDDVTAAAKAKSERQGQVRATYKVYQEDWGDVVGQVTELFRFFRDLPLHFAVLAHSRRGQDEEGNIRVGPAATPALQQHLMAYTDLVLLTKIRAAGESQIYMAQSKAVGRFDAKDRYGLLPLNLVDPSFDRVLSYIEGNLTEDKDPVQKAARDLINKSKEK